MNELIKEIPGKRTIDASILAWDKDLIGTRYRCLLGWSALPNSKMATQCFVPCCWRVL